MLQGVLEGNTIETPDDTTRRVETDAGFEIRAKFSRELPRHPACIVPGDGVAVEGSPSDQTHVRIVARR